MGHDTGAAKAQPACISTQSDQRIWYLHSEIILRKTIEGY